MPVVWLPVVWIARLLPSSTSPPPPVDSLSFARFSSAYFLCRVVSCIPFLSFLISASNPSSHSCDYGTSSLGFFPTMTAPDCDRCHSVLPLYSLYSCTRSSLLLPLLLPLLRRY